MKPQTEPSGVGTHPRMCIQVFNPGTGLLENYSTLMLFFVQISQAMPGGSARYPCLTILHYYEIIRKH